MVIIITCHFFKIQIPPFKDVMLLCIYIIAIQLKFLMLFEEWSILLPVYTRVNFEVLPVLHQPSITVCAYMFHFARVCTQSYWTCAIYTDFEIYCWSQEMFYKTLQSKRFIKLHNAFMLYSHQHQIRIKSKVYYGSLYSLYCMWICTGGW